MKFGRSQKSIVDILFILAVFCVFALTALFVILFGAGIYRNTVKNMSTNFNERTAPLYITERVRSNDFGTISIFDRNGIDVLTMESVHDDLVIDSYLYVYNESLCEYSGNASNEFNPKYGTPVLDLKSLNVGCVNDNLLRFELTYPDNSTENFYVSVKTGGVYEIR